MSAAAELEKTFWAFPRNQKISVKGHYAKNSYQGPLLETFGLPVPRNPNYHEKKHRIELIRRNQGDL